MSDIALVPHPKPAAGAPGFEHKRFKHKAGAYACSARYSLMARLAMAKARFATGTPAYSPT
jgi:hypothetical protein